MKTLEILSREPGSIPNTTSLYIADLSKYQGKQELFTRQSPQKLKILREHALAQSTVSSNRIEGVQVDQARIGTLIFGKPALKDRNEEEIQGYRNALTLIHTKGPDFPVIEKNILKLHRLSRGDIWDAGKYKNKNVDIIEKYPDGRSRVRFRSVPASKTPKAMRRTIKLLEDGMREGWVHPFIILAAFNLDFLCVHPFRDGNGRVSRLILLLTCYHAGLDVGRYISLDRIIEDNKERYYETLEISSYRWHEGKHDPWHYINYVLFILKEAYKEFEKRVGEIKAPRGAKMELVLSTIKQMDGLFTLSQLEAACPGVGREWIQTILGNLKKDKRVTCIGKGRGARWAFSE